MKITKENLDSVGFDALRRAMNYASDYIAYIKAKEKYEETAMEYGNYDPIDVLRQVIQMTEENIVDYVEDLAFEKEFCAEDSEQPKRDCSAAETAIMDYFRK